MNRKVLPLLLIPVMLYAGVVEIEYKFTQPVIRNNIVNLNGCRTAMVPFAPCVPQKDVTLLLPYGHEAVSFEVTCGSPIQLEGEYYIRPFRPGGRLSVPPPQGYCSKKRSATIYNTNEFYPQNIKSERFFTHYKNGNPVFIASINPVQVNPVSGRVQFFDRITVRVKTEAVKRNRPIRRFTPFIKSWLAIMVDNPEMLEAIPYTQAQPDYYEYLIVTMNSLKDSFDDFIAFNKRRCLRTKLVTINYVLANSSGANNAEKLKNFIIDEYNEYGIQYVLLGGDEEYGNNSYIPHKGYSAEFMDYGINYYIDTDIAADMYYETLDGEELDDLEWEVYAARFAVDDVSELQNMINKTIDYAEDPVTAAVTKVALLGEELWANITGGVCWGGNNMDQLVGECTDHYTTQGYDNNFTFTRLYEKNSNWTVSNLVSVVNGNIGWIDHLGHSNNFYIMKLNLDDVSRFTNTGYWIGYTEGCYCGSWDNRKIAGNANINTGHYQDDCIAEELTAQTDNGAVVFISNTRFGLGDDGHASADGLDGSSIRYHRFFKDAVFNKKIHFMAPMLAYAKEINKNAMLNLDLDSKPYFGQMDYACYETNALGDPALSVWTKTPQDLDPDYPSPLSGTTFEWNTNMPYTWVALLDEHDSIIATQLTGEDGVCNITDQALADYVSANPNGMLTINIKAHNYFPFSGELPITSTNITGNNDIFLFTSRFNAGGSTMHISYRLPSRGFVSIALYNSKGNCIDKLINGMQNSGNHALVFKNNTISNGIYYCRMMYNNTMMTKKFIVTK